MTSKVRIHRVSELKAPEQLDLHKILAGFISYSTLLPKRMEIGGYVLRTNAKANWEVLTVNFVCLFEQCSHFLHYFYFVALWALHGLSLTQPRKALACPQALTIWSSWCVSVRWSLPAQTRGPGQGAPSQSTATCAIARGGPSPSRMLVLPVLSPCRSLLALLFPGSQRYWERMLWSPPCWSVVSFSHLETNLRSLDLILLPSLGSLQA